MWILDPESLRFLEVNNAALAQYGYSHTEFHNLTIDEIIHEEDLPQFLEEIQKPGLPHILNTGNRRHYKKNGEIIDVEVTSHYLTYQGRNARLSMPHDITARKRAEKKLIESEEKLSLFVQHAPAALAMFDRDMRYIAASRRWLDDNKVSLKEIIGAVHYDIVPDISDEWKEIHRRALNGESDKNDDDKFVRQDGSVLFLKWEVRPWYNAEKEVGGIIIITEDITARKLNEEKIEVALIKYKTLFDNLPIGISISDNNGKIIETNSVAEDLLGITEEEHKKRSIDDRDWQIIRSDGTPMPTEEYASVRAIKAGKKVENMEMGILKPDRSVTWVNVVAAPFPIINHGVIVAFNDITARKKTEKQLIESEKRFATIFHDSPIPIAIISLKDGEIILTNPSVTNFLGYTQEELIGNTTLTMGIWADSNDRQEFIEKLRAHSRVYDMEAVLCLKSGEKRHALMWGELIEYYGEECVLLEIIDIHEKKIQEEKIRLQNEKLNAILHSLPDKLFIHDADGTFLEAYTTSPDGYIAPKEKFLGKKISDIFQKEIAELNLTYLRRCLQEREPVSHEFSTDYKGTYSTFEVRIVPFMDNKAIRFVRDITKSKENEREIFKLNKAIDNSPIAIVITDTNGIINYASSAFETTTGYSNDQVLGQNIRILESGKHPIELYANMWQTIESGNIWEGEMINRKKDGTFYWVYLTISPLYENEKQITGYLAVQQDITEKKKNEQKILELNSSLERRIEERTSELQSNQDKLMLSQRIAQLGIWEFNTKNDQVMWSEETYKIYERSPEKGPYTFKELLDSIYPEDREQFEKRGYSMIHGETLNSFVLRHYTDKGNLKWVKYYLKGIIENGEAIHVQGALLDITAEKQTQLQLEEAVHEAEEANKAKSIFLANMSHEIRTPLNSIIGFSELLYNTIDDDKKRSQIASIRNSGRSLLKIINDILDLSKVEADKMIVESEPINVFQVVTDVCSIFEPNIAEKNLHLTIEPVTVIDMPLLLDETRLRQILFNLVGNAIKFTFRGGISVGIDHEEKDEKTVDLKICIRDTGMGISEDELEAIFEPFVQQKGQTQKAFGGTGLGLTISRRMAGAMGGEISVKSKLNEGSEFTLLFKDILKADFIPDKVEKSFYDYSDIRFEESTILIVDDIEDNRRLLLDALEHTGARLLEAENGLQAVRIATEEIPDIILMDKRMPVMDGMAACKRLKENPITAGIVCIGVSATLRLGHSEDDTFYTFNNNLIKPINFEKLFEILIKYLKNTHRTAQSTLSETETMPATEPEWSDELKQYARVELIPLYHQVIHTQLIDDIEDFGRRLTEAGQLFENKKLIDTGNRIVDYADQFEVEKLTIILKEFKLIFDHKQ
jgi:PAS domain S-box-containing protein